MNNKKQNRKTRIENLIQSQYGDLTGSEKAIASYILENLQTIPFETGASLAEKMDVSGMTIIRFIRNLGYSNLRELKEELRDDDFDLDDALSRFHIQHVASNHLKASMTLEIRAVVKAYELVATKQWETITDMLSHIDTLHIVGFQATRGLAIDFASRLKYARKNVYFTAGMTGTYSQVLDSDPQKNCLIIVDTASYARKGILLAKKAKSLGIPIIVITDKYSHWALEYTENVLSGHTHIQTFWDSTASLSIILNLLINSVATTLGELSEKRFNQLRDLGLYFEEFTDATSVSGNLMKPSKKTDSSNEDVAEFDTGICSKRKQ